VSSCLWKVAVGMALFGFVATLEVPAAVAKEPTAITDQTKSFEGKRGSHLLYCGSPQGEKHMERMTMALDVVACGMFHGRCDNRGQNICSIMG
jgi:hypothetical protein